MTKATATGSAEKDHSDTSSRHLASGLLHSLARIAGTRKQDTQPSPHCIDNSGQLSNCSGPEQWTGPLHVIPLQQFLPLSSQYFEEEFPALPMMGCVPVVFGDLTIELALELRYEQRWFYQRYLVSDLLSTIALAPGEEVKINVKETQRKLFDHKTLEQVESTESTESAILDKDVVNVTRSSTHNENWNVSGNAGITIPVGDVPLELGVQGGYSSAVNTTAQSATDRVSEATRKSSRSLKTLHNVEVRTTSEAIAEQGKARTLVNPYNDRALLIKVFELSKEYCVETCLTEVSHALLLTIRNLTFDRAFVLNYRSFLAEALLDPMLQAELVSALNATSDLRFGRATERRAIEIAKLCLKYLFEVENVFNVPGYLLIPGDQANAPQLSFDASLPGPALADALANAQGHTFTALNLYYRLYKDLLLGENPRDDLAVELALSLESYVGPMWNAIVDAKNLLDTSQRTEIFRRLSGFSAMVAGILKPLVQPLEIEREEVRSAQRTEFVIDRIVSHLNCHFAYYTEQYLLYIGRNTSFESIKAFVRGVLPLMRDHQVLSELFDVDRVFLDRNRIVVPSRRQVTSQELQDIAKELDGDSFQEIVLGTKTVEEKVMVPLDGVVFEPVVGSCVLDAPPPPNQAYSLDSTISVRPGTS